MYFSRYDQTLRRPQSVSEVTELLLPQAEAFAVFDMSGFGLSNMDWDTATMVIKIFESYYPETLGHALIYNAPTVFSAVWKIVKPMLDPAVREKVHFASSATEMEKFIDPKHLEKDFGGASSWRYRFKGPVPGENKHMEDEETKSKRKAAYMASVEVSRYTCWLLNERLTDSMRAAEI